MGNEVQRVQTAVSEPQMAQGIIEAWGDLFKTVPSKEQVSLILAQNALETGSRKFMWNYNVGNIKANPTGPYDYFYLRGPEQTAPGKWEKLRMPFRAYSSLRDGVKDYLTLLSKSRRYASAWQHIITPDPGAFSQALKAGGYDTADEAPYTKGLTALYNKFNKSKSYDAARSGQASTPEMLAQNKNQGGGFNMSSITQLIAKFLQQITSQPLSAAASNKKLYKKFLPKNCMTIHVKADYTDAVEFARILCTALDEELSADAFTHTDGSDVEVQCSIHGPSEECFKSVQQLTASLQGAFQQATKKIGGIEVKTDFIMNKKSSYQEINLTTAVQQHRKFLLKFI